MADTATGVEICNSFTAVLLFKREEGSLSLSLCDGTVRSTKKGKALPVYAWLGSKGCSRLRITEFLGARQMKVVTLSALRTGRLVLISVRD